MKRQDRSRDTRMRAAAAAKALFLERPYREVTIGKIAAEIGRAQPTLYRYWPDKASLWREVMGCAPPLEGGDFQSMRRLAQARAELLEEVRSRLDEAERATLPAEIEVLLRKAIEVLTERPAPDEQEADARGPRAGRGPAAATLRRRGAPILRAADRAIGQAIRTRRRALGFTLADTGAALGISKNQVARYELGEAPLPAALAPGLAAMLGCSLDALLSAASPSDKGP